MKSYFSPFYALLLLGMAALALVSCDTPLEKADEAMKKARQSTAKLDQNSSRFYYKKAAHYYQEAAQDGEPKACFCLALSYSETTGGRLGYEHLGLSPNKQQSFRYINKSAEQGYAPALIFLAWTYTRGAGVDIPQDLDKAAAYSEQARAGLIELAIKGEPESEFLLGIMLLEGRFIKANPRQGLSYLTSAANKGFADAQWYLAHQYRTGCFIPGQPRLALELYTKAARQGQQLAQFALATHYTPGDSKLAKPNAAKAAYWMQRALAQRTSRQILLEPIENEPQ